MAGRIPDSSLRSFVTSAAADGSLEVFDPPVAPAHSANVALFANYMAAKEVRRILVIGEFALALALLAGAGGLLGAVVLRRCRRTG